VGDAVWLLVVIGLALFAVGWAGRALYDREKTGDVWLAGYDKAAEDWEFRGPEREAAAEREHEAAWAAEFSEPDLGDFVTGVLELPAAEPIEGRVGVRDGDGIVVPQLMFPPDQWTTLDNRATGERLPTVAEVRNNADYWLWRTEMAGLIEGAAAWYDEAFATGQFRAVR
jgi:hypothetical protein